MKTLCLPNSTNLGTFNSGEPVKRLPAAFYQSSSGREPVRAWLKNLAAEDRKVIGEDIKDVEFSWPIGMPLCRALGKGLWEIRSDLARGRIARVLFCVRDSRMVLLHGFIKKTQKTPDADLELAIRRRKEIT
jgi:phage-related protein